MNLTPEQKAIGQENYYEALGVNRRDFLKGVVATGAVSGAGLGAMYFGYGDESQGLADPVRIGIIGTGDEGNVLIGALNPAYVTVKSIADIRPYNIHRAFYGDWASPAALAARPGLMTKYGWATEEEARKNVQVVTDYKDLLKNPDIEAVIIALPLHLHASVAIEAMNEGKHVLTEKLMAQTVGACKEMSRVAIEKNLLLATGHQRHYSVLYDNAVKMIQWGLLGELHFIRAQWHRGNLPGADSWSQPIPGGETIGLNTFDPIGDKLKAFEGKIKNMDASAAKGRAVDSKEYDKFVAQIAQWTAWQKDKDVEAAKYGYESKTMPDGRNRSALEELCRWRLWNRTGGGLMAELGSHQLDAASIFISALRGDGKKTYPMTVHAVGGRHVFPEDRDADDHVYCTYEFPGPGYDYDFGVGYKDKALDYPSEEKGIPSYNEDPNKKIIMTYSSTMGNGFGGYGETVMGSKGTLILEREKEAMLFKGSNTSSKIKVTEGAGGPTMDTAESGGPAAPVAKAANTGPISRGYAEEIEHFAWCIRNRAPENQPKCGPEVALGDAVMALTSKLAIDRSKTDQGGYIRFKEEWFDIDSDATPEEELK